MNNRISDLKVLILGMTILFVSFPAAGQGILVPDTTGRVPSSTSSNAAQTNPLETGSSLHKRNWRYRVNPSDTLEL